MSATRGASHDISTEPASAETRHEPRERREEPPTRYEDLVQNAPDVLVLVDADGSIRFTNDRITDLFGYDRDELNGQSVEILVPGSLRDRHVRERQAYMRGPVARPMGAGLDLQARRKDGSLFPVDISLTPLETPGGPMVMATVRDITERERTRSARLR